MDSEQIKILASFIADAFRQTLPELQLELVDNTYEDEIVNWPESIMVSIMRFQSEAMKGTAVLGCDLGFLERSCPAFEGDHEERDLFLQDWIGELSNLVLGRLKNKLLPFGIVLKLNPPSVTEAGASIFETYAVHERQLKLWFSCDQDFICLSFSLDLAASIDLQNEKPHSDAQLQPGDAIYRLNDPYGAKQNYDMVSKVRSGVDLDDEPSEIALFDFELTNDSRPERESWASSSPFASTPLPSAPPPLLSSQGSGKLAVQKSDIVDPPAGSRPQLRGLRWFNEDSVLITFSEQTSYVISLRVLLLQGTQILNLEGYAIHLVQNGPVMQLLIPELQLTLEHGGQAA